MASNVTKVTISLVGLVAVFHLMTPIAVIMYWNHWPKMSQMALKAVMTTLIVIEVIVVSTIILIECVAELFGMIWYGET